MENTGIIGENAFFSEDHLHIRGEYDAMAKIVAAKAGSSPHTWRIPYLALIL